MADPFLDFLQQAYDPPAPVPAPALEQEQGDFGFRDFIEQQGPVVEFAPEDAIALEAEDGYEPPVKISNVQVLDPGQGDVLSPAPLPDREPPAPPSEPWAAQDWYTPDPTESKTLSEIAAEAAGSVGAYEQERQAPDDDLIAPGSIAPATEEEQFLRPYEQAGAAESTKADLVADAQRQEATSKQTALNDMLLKSEEAWSRHEQRMQSIEKRQVELARETDEIANTRIDPNRRFANATTAEKLAWFGQAIAGGYFAARNGGRNLGLEMIERVIQQDLDTQVQQLQARRGMLGDKMTLLQQDIAAGQDAYESYQKHLAAQLFTSAKIVEAETAKSDSDVTRIEGSQRAGMLIAKGQEALHSIRVRQHEEARKQTKDDLENLKTIAETQRIEAETAKKLGGGGGVTSAVKGIIGSAPGSATSAAPLGVTRPQLEQRIAELNSTGIKQDREQAKRMASIADQAVYGKDSTIIGYARSAEDARHVSEDISNFEAFRDLTQELVGLYGEADRWERFGGVVGQRGASDAYKKITSKTSSLYMLAKGKGIGELGVLAGPDMKLIEQLVGKAGGITGADPRPNLKAALDTYDQKINRHLRARFGFIGTYQENPQRAAGESKPPPARPPSSSGESKLARSESVLKIALQSVTGDEPGPGATYQRMYDAVRGSRKDAVRLGLDPDEIKSYQRKARELLSAEGIEVSF